MILSLGSLVAGNGIAQNISRHRETRQSEAERAIVSAADRHPNDPGPAVAAGEYFYRQGRWKESSLWLLRAYSLSGENERIGYELSYAEIQAGKLDAARRHLQEISARKDAAQIHTLLAMVDERLRKYAGAAQEYHRAAELNLSESTIFDLADFLLQHKRFVGYLPESVKFFRYGASRYPSSAKLRTGLGVALYASKDYDEAIRTLCEAVELNPADPRPITILGMARRVSPELAKVVDRHLQDFVQRYPNNAAANYEYAVSLWERGGGELGQNRSQIETLLYKAVARDPRWYQPHYQLGILLDSEGKYKEAIQEMRTTCLLEPSFKPAHFRLAMLYKRVGDQKHSKEEAARARQLDNAEIQDSMHRGTSK